MHNDAASGVGGPANPLEVPGSGGSLGLVGTNYVEHMNAIEFLQHWYAAQCNGDWEHEYGITVSTLDNPGWRVSISLVGTALFGVSMNEIRTELAPDNWMVCFLRDGEFQGCGDPTKLESILCVFQAFAAPEVEPG